jgi:amino acid transporter
MPGSGGTYVYLREAFTNSRWGRLLPFLFIWQFIFSGPLEIASGLIGFAQYTTYIFPALAGSGKYVVVAAAGGLVTALLYRRIGEIGKLTVVLWTGMLITVAVMIVSGAFRFQASLAFDFPPGAFEFSRGFALGLGGAMLIAMYDFLGYYDICYVGGEVREPGRVIPRAILISVVAVALIYAVLNLMIMGVVPWREAMKSEYIASLYMERIFGGWAGVAVTVMILWTAIASVFALMLGYSRIPYAAAIDGYFFPAFGKLHPKGEFPHVSLLTIGGLSILAGMLTLEWVVSALITARILVQFIGQIAALAYLRRHKPAMARPFLMPLYPLPAIIALVGWLYIFGTAGAVFIGYGLLSLLAGVIAFRIWAAVRTPTSA